MVEPASRSNRRFVRREIDNTPVPLERVGGVLRPADGRVDWMLSMAVRVFLGVGISAWPTRLPGRLHNYVGAELAPGLQTEVEALISEGGRDPHAWTGDLGAAARRFEATMRTAHPELSADAARALAWYWSYQYK